MARFHLPLTPNKQTTKLLTEIKVVVVEQKLRQIEEFWNEFFNVSHVVFSGRQPGVFDAVEHAVSKVKVSSLTTTTIQLTNSQSTQHYFPFHCDDASRVLNFAETEIPTSHTETPVFLFNQLIFLQPLHIRLLPKSKLLGIA